MTSFDYNAPAELFLSKPAKGSRAKYRRFATAAEALRYAVLVCLVLYRDHRVGDWWPPKRNQKGVGRGTLARRSGSGSWSLGTCYKAWTKPLRGAARMTKLRRRAHVLMLTSCASFWHLARSRDAVHLRSDR